MTNNGFLDNNSVLFGRRAELAYLLERNERSCVSAILGQAQKAESWLLFEAVG